MKRIYIILTLVAIILIPTYLIAQSKSNPLEAQFNNKVTELYTKYKSDGFITYKGGNVNMNKTLNFQFL